MVQIFFIKEEFGNKKKKSYFKNWPNQIDQHQLLIKSNKQIEKQRGFEKETERS